MDIVAAIKVHADWKGQLLSCAEGSQPVGMDAATAAADDRCQLGQWLHGDGMLLLSGQAQYEDLLTLHATFHREAAAIVRLIDAGQSAPALRIIADPSSPFSVASAQVIALLMVFKEHQETL